MNIHSITVDSDLGQVISNEHSINNYEKDWSITSDYNLYLLCIMSCYELTSLIC